MKVGTLILNGSKLVGKIKVTEKELKKNRTKTQDCKKEIALCVFYKQMKRIFVSPFFGVIAVAARAGSFKRV